MLAIFTNFSFFTKDTSVHRIMFRIIRCTELLSLLGVSLDTRDADSIRLTKLMSFHPYRGSLNALGRRDLQSDLRIGIENRESPRACTLVDTTDNCGDRLSPIDTYVRNAIE